MTAAHDALLARLGELLSRVAVERLVFRRLSGIVRDDNSTSLREIADELDGLQELLELYIKELSP